MTHNDVEKNVELTNMLNHLIKEAPKYGSISIQIVFHDGRINRLKTSKEESVQLNKTILKDEIYGK